MTKQNVFIGSSSEHIELAKSIQINLKDMNDIIPVVWKQGVFKPSEYPIESLLTALQKSSFAIFVLADDDYITIGGEEAKIARDNVIFELGLFMGVLGRRRTFFVIPDDSEIKYRLPSDLYGINYTTYSKKNFEENPDAAMGIACTYIEREIAKTIIEPDFGMIFKKFGRYNEFDGSYTELFKKSSQITTSFVHSKNWRENNRLNIEQFFSRDNALWNVILPNFGNIQLIESLKVHFPDGPTLESKILDAYKFFDTYQQKNSEKIKIFTYDLYPTYSFYKFDNELIFSLYPLSNERRSSPTFQLNMQSQYSDFFKWDIDYLLSVKKPLTSVKIKKFKITFEEN